MNNYSYKLGDGIRHLSVLGLIGRILGFVNLFILLTLLTIAEYGLFSLINVNLVLVASVVSLSLDELVVSNTVKEQKKNARESNSLLASFIKLNLFGSILMSFPILVLLAFDILENIIKWEALVIIFFIVLIAPFQKLALLFFQIREQFHKIKTLELFGNSSKTVGYIVFIYIFDLGLLGALFSMLVSQLLLIVLAGQRFFNEALNALRFANLKPLLSLIRTGGKWASVRGLVLAGNESLRAWLFILVLGAEALAIFNAAKTFSGSVKSLLPLKRVLLPLMSRKLIEDGQLNEIFSQSFRLSFWMMLVVAFGIILATPLLIPIYMPKYQPAILVIQLMAINLPFIGGGVQTILFVLFNRNKVLFYTALLNLGFSLVLMLPAMYYFGLLGGVIAFITSSFLITIIRFGYLKQTEPSFSFHVKDIFDFKREDTLLIKGLFNKN